MILVVIHKSNSESKNCYKCHISIQNLDKCSMKYLNKPHFSQNLFVLNTFMYFKSKVHNF